MAKVLNLDELAAEERVLTLKGERYPMKEMTVKDYIELTREQEKFDKEEKQLTESQKVERLVDMIHRSFPSCPREVLEGLQIRQLVAVLEFAREGADSQAEQASKVGASEKN